MRRHASKIRIQWSDKGSGGEIEAAGWPALLVAVALAVGIIAWAAVKLGVI
jgi:hypothetical protein